MGGLSDECLVGISPQVRTLAQPLVMVIPMLYAGMLLGGVSALKGLLVTFLLIAVTFVANILAGVIALQMLRKKKEQQRNGQGSCR